MVLHGVMMAILIVQAIAKDLVFTQPGVVLQESGFVSGNLFLNAYRSIPSVRCILSLKINQICLKLLKFYNYLSNILFSAFTLVDSLPVRVVFRKPMLNSERAEDMDNIFDKQNRRSGVIHTPKDELKEKYSILTFNYLMELVAIITYAELRTIKINNDK